MKKLVLIVAVFAILLISCTPKIKEGEVYDKDFRPAHTTIILMPIVHYAGKTTFTTLVPMCFFYPDAWYISYRAFNEKSKKWDTATVWVPREVYDLAQVGGWYERTENDLDERPRVRQKDKEQLTTAST